MKIVWDGSKCAALGVCESIAPDSFEIGDDGVLVVKTPQVPEEERELMERVVASCPTAALSIEEE